MTQPKPFKTVFVARKSKQGLDYFPLDVDFFEDDKIELISSEFGPKGEAITLRILCKIFRNGYYYQWGKEESLLFAKRVGGGVTGALVDEVVQGLIKRSFFDKGVFDSFTVLTSKGIQTRYIEAKERAKQVVIFREYALIDINAPFKGINVTFIGINDNINPQRRVEKIKEEESKVDGATPQEIDAIVIFDVEAFLNANQQHFERICMAAGRDRDTGQHVLRKYHLYLEEKEQYPKTKKSLMAGFQKWLMNENSNNGGKGKHNTAHKPGLASGQYTGL